MRFRKVIYVCRDGIIVCKCTTLRFGNKYEYIDPKKLIEIRVIESNLESLELRIVDMTNVIIVAKRSVKTQLQILTNKIEKEKIYDKKFN